MYVYTGEESQLNVFFIPEFKIQFCLIAGVWALVNNAAVNFVGDVEFCTMQQYKTVSEVNYFGVVHMTKAFLPQIRKSKGIL